MSRGERLRVPRTSRYRGDVWPLFGGRCVLSQDAPWALLVSLVLLVGVPALWLVWEAPYLCKSVSVVPVVLVVYFWMNAVASMLYVILKCSDAVWRRCGTQVLCHAI